MDGLVGYILQELAFEGDLGSDVTRLRQIISQFYSTHPLSSGDTQNIDDKFCAFVWGLIATQDNVIVGVAPDGASAVYFPPQPSKAKQEDKGKGKSKANSDSSQPSSLLPLSPDEVTSQPLYALTAQYGNRLRIAIPPDLCFVCLTGSHVRPPRLSPNAYAVLQLITRTRREGISAADISRQSGYDPKTCFYFIKVLVELGHILKIKVGGVAVNICIHKSFYDDQCVWKQASKEENLDPEARGNDEASGHNQTEKANTNAGFTGHLKFEEIDSRHMTNPIIVKSRIERLLRHMPAGLHAFRGLLEAIGFESPVKKERRTFVYRVNELIKARFIEKVWAKAPTDSGRVLCIRLVSENNTPDDLEVADDAADDAQDDEKEEAVPVEDEGEVQPGSNDDLEQFEGVHATQSIASQIISLVEQSGATGMTLAEISKHLQNFDIRSIIRLTACFAATQPPTHLMHRALVLVTEFQGRERRQRAYTLTAYREMIEQEGLEDQSVLDLQGSGTWAMFDPSEFVADEDQRIKWLGNFILNALTGNKPKVQAQQAKKKRANPLNEVGNPVRGRPRKEWTQGPKTPKPRGRPRKRKVADTGDVEIEQSSASKRRRQTSPEAAIEEGNKSRDNVIGDASAVALPSLDIATTASKPRKPRTRKPIAPGDTSQVHDESPGGPSAPTKGRDTVTTPGGRGSTVRSNSTDPQAERPTQTVANVRISTPSVPRPGSPICTSGSTERQRPIKTGASIQKTGHQCCSSLEAEQVEHAISEEQPSSTRDPLDGLVPDTPNAPAPVTEQVAQEPAVAFKVAADRQTSAPSVPRQSENTNVSALRRQTEFLQLIENMGGVANVSLLKTFSDEHQKLLQSLEASGKPTSNAPGTSMDKRTFNSAISSLEARGLVKKLIVSTVSANGTTRRATIVHLVDTPPETIEKCVEAFRSASSRGIPIARNFPEVGGSVSDGVRRTSSQPTPPPPPPLPTVTRPPVDPLTLARDAQLSESRTAAQFVGYIIGHFSRARTLHLRLLSETNLAAPSAELVSVDARVFKCEYLSHGLPISTYCKVVPQKDVIPGLKELLEADAGGETRICDVPEPILTRLRRRSNKALVQKLLSSLADLDCLVPVQVEVDPGSGTTRYVDLPNATSDWEYFKLTTTVPVYRYADRSLQVPLCSLHKVQTVDDGYMLWEQIRKASHEFSCTDLEIHSSGNHFSGDPKLLKSLRRKGAWTDNYVLSESQCNYLNNLVDGLTGTTPLDDESSTRFDNACFVTTAPVRVVSDFFSKRRTDIQRDIEHIKLASQQHVAKNQKTSAAARLTLAAKAAQAKKDQEACWDSLVLNSLGDKPPTHPSFLKALAALKADFMISHQKTKGSEWEAKIKEAFRDSLGAKQFVIVAPAPRPEAPVAPPSQPGSEPSVRSLISQQGAPIQQKDIAPKKPGRKPKAKIHQETAAIVKAIDTPAVEPEGRKHRFPWNHEYDELARDAGAVIRVRCRGKRMDWSALEQVFPSVQRNRVRQRISSLETLPGAPEYYRRLDNAWAALWLQYRGSDSLPDSNPDSVSDFDLPAHVTFLRQHIDKAALHAGAEVPKNNSNATCLRLDSVEQILANYDIAEGASVPQPTNWDFCFETFTEEPREREFLRHSFVIHDAEPTSRSSSVGISVAQTAIKMVISTPESMYNTNDAAALLAPLGDETVDLAVVGMHDSIIQKKTKSSKNHPTRQYDFSDETYALLKGCFASSMYADASAMHENLDSLEDHEWRSIELTDENGETAAYLQLISDNKLETTIDTSIPAMGRKQLGWLSKKVADENLEARIAVRPQYDLESFLDGATSLKPSNPDEQAVGSCSNLISGFCSHLPHTNIECIDCLAVAQDQIQDPRQLDLLLIIRDAGPSGLSVQHILNVTFEGNYAAMSSALDGLTRTNPPLVYVLGYDRPRIISASALPDWTVRVVQSTPGAAGAKFKMLFPRQWFSIHGAFLEHIWTTATRAVVGALMFRPSISQYELRRRYGGLFDRQELNDILEYLVTMNKATYFTSTDLPVSMLGPEHEKSIYWTLSGEIM